MRLTRWICAVSVLALAACSSPRGGFSGTIDSDAGDDAPATGDIASMDRAPGEDAPVTPDTPVTADTPVTPDAPVGPDAPKTPDVPVTPDAPVGPDAPEVRCGDGTCSPGETCESCRADCASMCPPPPDVPATPRCGDLVCNGDETCTSCVLDCGICMEDRCRVTTVCLDCTRRAIPCGWCAESNSCMSINPLTGMPDMGGSCPSRPVMAGGSCTAPDPCAALSTCAACATNAACGWCAGLNRCAAGTATGPSPAVTSCGTWVRSSASCGGATSVLTPCAAGVMQGPSRNCGWRAGVTLSCTPGRATMVGCSGTAGTGSLCQPPYGVCSGDPVMRVCPGNTPCTSSTALVASSGDVDDACGTCPSAYVTCPTSGQIHVLTGDYDSNVAAQRGTCTPAVR